MTDMTIGQALDAALKSTHTTKTELARLVGTDQGTVSRWCQDDPKYHLRPERIAAIERALSIPLGSILAAAGLVSQIATVPDAIAADVLINNDDRDALIAHWRALRKRDDGFDANQ